MRFDRLILALSDYWAELGCAIVQPYDLEKGAGTFSPHTFLRAIGPKPWRAAYVEPSRRPTDGRYGENPNRLQHYYQYQVVLKPAPREAQEVYLDSLSAIGIDLASHDVRFVEDDWESPTLGAWGLGWEVWLDGMEITQFTYFQQVGGIDCDPVTLELTYGLERIAMYLQEKNSVYDVAWTDAMTYGDVHLETERQWSHYNFHHADVDFARATFEKAEEEVERLLQTDPVLVFPAYDWVLKASHAFNLLDARGAISVTERAARIGRVRRLAERVARAYAALLARRGGGAGEESDG